MRLHRSLVIGVAVALVGLESSCGGADGKGIGWGGGVQIFAKAGTIDTSAVAGVSVCVEDTCADLARQEIGARPGRPRPFGFPFAFEDVQDRNGIPLAGKQLRVHVTIRTAANNVIAEGSASTELWYVSPVGWYCDEELAQRVIFDYGPVVAVEFQSASRLVGVDVRVPKPSCPSPST